MPGPGSQLLEVQTKGLDRLQRRLSLLPFAGAAGVEERMKLSAGEAVRVSVAELTPKVSGRLAAGWEVVTLPSAVRVQNQEPYTHFIEEGWRDDPRFGRVFRKAGGAHMLALGRKRAAAKIGVAVRRAGEQIKAWWLRG